MTGKRPFLAPILIAAVLLGAGVLVRDLWNRRELHGVRGPSGTTRVPGEVTTPWQTYNGGGRSCLAVLLTDPDSPWLAVAHALKTIGIPFLITRDVREAVKHHVVLVYPEISGRVLPARAFDDLRMFVKQGGTLAATGVLGGGLQDVFGFRIAEPSQARYAIRFQDDIRRLVPLMDPRERTIPLGLRGRGEALGTEGYVDAGGVPLAVFEDGRAALLFHSYGRGRAYAFGLDLGELIHAGYDLRDETIHRSYVNEYEPSIDVFLRLLKEIYSQGEPNAVILDTVPMGKELSVLVTHDIDSAVAVGNAVAYAEYERREGIPATYFLQAKYIRDYNDEAFFDAKGIAMVRRLGALGMELGNHSVSHSRQFASFPFGSGAERYPSYRPFVHDPSRTTGGTILGELRVGKFLIDEFSQAAKVVSFRPGGLLNPFSLPEALWASGYRYSSSATADNALTHLPFRLSYGRRPRSEVPVFEFPVTIEDEALPRLGERLPAALELAEKLASYHACFVILIHPDILGHKLDFERGFVAAWRKRAWFGTLSDFGAWWSARSEAELDVKVGEGERTVVLTLPSTITGLPLRVPMHWRFLSADPAAAVRAERGLVLVSASAHEVSLHFRE